MQQRTIPETWIKLQVLQALSTKYTQQNEKESEKSRMPIVGLLQNLIDILKVFVQCQLDFSKKSCSFAFYHFATAE